MLLLTLRSAIQSAILALQIDVVVVQYKDKGVLNPNIEASAPYHRCYRFGRNICYVIKPSMYIIIMSARIIHVLIR